MAADNPRALTWIFSLQITDTDDYTSEIEYLTAASADPTVQYLAFHVVQFSSIEAPYIRGILRCYSPRCHTQLQNTLFGATIKPLRGQLTPGLVADKLRPTRRISEFYEFGAISLTGRKRALSCTGTCKTCCFNNKKPSLYQLSLLCDELLHHRELYQFKTSC